jgi:hypothetical protein
MAPEEPACEDLLLTTTDKLFYHHSPVLTVIRLLKNCFRSIEVIYFPEGLPEKLQDLTLNTVVVLKIFCWQT